MNDQNINNTQTTFDILNNNNNNNQELFDDFSLINDLLQSFNDDEFVTIPFSVKVFFVCKASTNFIILCFLFLINFCKYINFFIK